MKVAGDGSGSDGSSSTRRSRLRRRAVFSAGAAVMVGAAGLVYLSGHGGTAGHPSGSNVHLAIVGHSGSAVELAANTSPAAPRVSTDAESQVSTAEIGFSLSLLRQLNADRARDANVVASPSSLATVLAMLELGAHGSTASQIATTLGTADLTGPQQAAAWNALSTDEARAATRAGIDLESANSLWMQSGLPLAPAFMSELRQQFAAGVWQVDFEHDASQAVDALNSWVSASTHGRITQLFSPGTIDATTALILANALYFKGAWQQPFDPDETATKLFHTAAGGTTPAPFMFSDALTAPVTRGAQYDAIQLPYKEGRFAALVVMPSTQSLARFVAGLTPTSLDLLTRGLEDKPVNLFMPRFQLTDGTNLNGILQSMGMRDAFGGADLSGLSSTPLFVQQVEQRVFLKVTEQGTEAAAATGISVATSLRDAESISINHPFLFFIRDTTTGAILFEAEVENLAS